MVLAFSLFVLYWHRGPGFVRIESLHVLELIESLRPEIFLVDNAVVADDEGPHTGDCILRRRSHEGKAPDHYSFNYEIQFAEWSCRALPFENLEEVAVVRLAAAITLFNGAGDLVTYRTSPGAIGVLPRQAILLAGRANDALGILVNLVALVRLKSILVLSFYIAAGDCNRVQFIGSDPAVEEFLLTGFGVEEPLLALLHKRHGKRPVLVADEQKRALSGVLDKVGIDGIAANFLKLVATNRRLFAARDMVKAYRALVARHKGEVTAEVTLAEKPSEAHLAAIKDALMAMTKKDVHMDVKVDPAIIGGLVVKLGSRMVDSSLRTKLNAIKHAMKEVS